jgi:hypothetical protein
MAKAEKQERHDHRCSVFFYRRNAKRIGSDFSWRLLAALRCNSGHTIVFCSAFFIDNAFESFFRKFLKGHFGKHSPSLRSGYCPITPLQITLDSASWKGFAMLPALIGLFARPQVIESADELTNSSDEENVTQNQITHSAG